MDALALLCTLHADGPATLKRLRARGYANLASLMTRSAEDLSADLDVEPAFARRLLREAKVLAARVGAEGLEAEEAPPIATAAESSRADSESIPPSIPLSPPPAGSTASTLDDRDRTLVERIVTAPEQADAGAEADSKAEPLVAAPAAEPPAAEAPPEPPAEICPLEAASLPGLDADLIFDLKASGITTLEELAAADSLQLTRALGVTFAQARRLGFLARRAAAVASPEGATDARPARRIVTTRREVPAEPAVAKPAPREVPLPQVTLAPHRRSEPVAPGEPSPPAESPAESPSGPTSGSKNDLLRLSGGVGAPVQPSDSPSADSTAAQPTASPEVATPMEAPAENPAERTPFWEPRQHLTDSVEDQKASQQGVKVDPAEIAPRPRFGDRLAQAAEVERQRLSSSRNAGSASGAGAVGSTVLGWNFEIPRPEDEPALPLGSVAVPRDEPAPATSPQAEESPVGDQDRGGPFA